MKHYLLILLAVLCSCQKPRQTIIIPGSWEGQEAKVTKFEVKKENDIWKLYKNGKEFYIKGAATNRYYSKVKDFGGNTVRTYSTNETQTPDILKEALENGLYVNMGLSIGRERDGFDYNDKEKVAAQLEKCRKMVQLYRNHPAVFCWSIGNEADSQYKNLALWTAINDIAKMIHEEDPNHLVTTTLSNSDVDKVQKIVEMAPELDILCINTYYPNTKNVYTNLQKAGWTKPYMITEFGHQGTWTSSIPKTSWGKLIELTSTEKAEFYKEIMEEDIAPNKTKGCIGSFPFVWGYQNHGEVLTWYGLFDKEGRSFGAVDEIQKFWTGSYPDKLAPVIKDAKAMTINDLTVDKNIILSVGSKNTASVKASSVWKSELTYKWLIYAEGTAASDGSLPDGISGLITDDKLATIEFTAPGMGEYRLVVFVYDTNNKVASAVIPFKVQ